MKLIDTDALVDALMTYTWRDEDERLIDDADEKREYIKQWLPDLPTVSGWVSVKDRTPEEKGWYMVYAPGYSGGSSSGLDSHNGVMFAKWSGKTWSIEVGYHKRPGCVRKWMPIPEPPEEDEKHGR